MLVYQRVYPINILLNPIKSHLNPIKPPFSYGFPMVFFSTSAQFSEPSGNVAPNRGGMLEVLGDAEGGTTRGVDVPRGAGDAAASVGVSENLGAVRNGRRNGEKPW